MIENERYVVREGGVRLDAALLSFVPTSTRAFCRDACNEGTVKVNGKFASKGLKLKAGDEINVISLVEAKDNTVFPNKAIRVRCIFEDDSLLAFDKEPGIPVQPLSFRERDTMMNGVVARWPEVAPLGDQPLMAGALHRIDADTGGLVLVARNQAAFENVRSQFASQSVKKTYLALVEGLVAVGGTLENDLVHDPTLPFCRMIDISRARCAVRTGPLRAVTNFKPIAHTQVGGEARTLLEVVIYTGVTHQIRAQLAMAGMHIVNDRLYGAFAVEHQTGHCLHALAASFKHPVTHQDVEIRTEYPTWARF